MEVCRSKFWFHDQFWILILIGQSQWPFKLKWIKDAANGVNHVTWREGSPESEIEEIDCSSASSSTTIRHIVDKFGTEEWVLNLKKWIKNYSDPTTVLSGLDNVLRWYSPKQGGPPFRVCSEMMENGAFIVAVDTGGNAELNRHVDAACSVKLQMDYM